MYRRSKKHQQLRSRVAASIASRERKHLCSKNGEENEPILPDLRKKLEITDYDHGEPQVTE